MTIDYKVPINVFRVGDTCFSDQQISDMFARTNSKISVAGIQIEINSITSIPDKSKAYISQINGKYADLKSLLNNGYQPGITNKILRLFMVKYELDENLSAWTYDPAEEELFQGAIFITELFNDNSDQAYETQGYLKSNDSLLHELGHTLMYVTDHFTDLQYNFFHEFSIYTDDSITTEQITRLRGEETPARSPGTPNYLRAF